MNTINVRGTSYELRGDGLFYKELVISDISYSVPMFVSRNKTGWRVRIKLNDNNVIREYCMDGHKADQSQEERISASLAKAVAFIKQHLHGDPNDPTVKYQRRIRNKRVIPGVVFKTVTCKNLSKAPVVKISAQLPGHNRVISGTNSKLDIFSNTEKEILDDISQAMIGRRFCDELYKSGMVIPDNPIQTITPEERRALLEGIDCKFNPFEVIVNEIEEKVDISTLDTSKVHSLEVGGQIIVDRVFKQPGQISERKSFAISDYSSLELARRVAFLYGAHLASTEPKMLRAFAY